MRFQNLPPKRDRKGITLLFVVSMIVLFMLLATTFLVVSSQYLRGARSYAKSEIFERQPQNDLDQVLYMLLRDSRDPNNPLRTHSLLADVYGYNSIVKGTVVKGTAQYVFGSDNSFIQVAVQNVDIPGFDGTVGLDGNPKQFSLNKNSHIGQLFTVTTGGMQGVTCRIVGHVYNPNDERHYFRLFPYIDNFFTDATSLIAALNDNAEFIVNGRPFSGTGAGFTADVDSEYRANDSVNTQTHLPRLSGQAFLPNRTGFDEAGLLTDYVGFGDVNEDYDAPDYQNCFLAAEVPSLVSGNYTVTVLPSFHRQALISDRRIAAGGNLQARTLFRPNPTDNPNFPPLTGLNLETNVVALDSGNFIWDVDNDMDRINDSVWVDPNLPVMTDKSGRKYKRLFAILCRDMDGKFNLNAHSNRWHLDSEYTADLVTGGPTLPSIADEANNTTVSTVASLDGGITSALPRGQGYGPAEINMRTLLGTDDFNRLMYGNSVAGVWGRNGQETGHPVPRPGIPLATGIDVATLTTLYDVSQGFPIFAGSYGSYPDIQGRYAFGIDFNGQPVFSLTTSANEIHENEYERNIMNSSIAGGSKNTSVATNLQTDAPFSYAEIERILRGNDNDASSLPNRILQLAPNAFSDVSTNNARSQTMYNRMNFGAHSFDTPSIPIDFVDELREEMSRILFGTQFEFLAAPQRFLIEEDLEEMLPPELFAGVPYNLNRILGDGVDQNNDLVTDNHYGLWSLDLEDSPGIVSAISEAHFDEIDPANRNLDLDNDGRIGVADGDEHLVRYHNAKYLYVMMRMIMRTSGVDASDALRSDVIGNQDLDGNGTFNEEEDLAIFVAQWAINVVDFRDKDSIMTPFEFDLNPFDGWHVDGNPMYQDVLRDGNNIPINDNSGPTANVTHRGNNYTATQEQDVYVVYGLEKPSLLMTETLAFHDRRTEDTEDDTPGVPGNPNPPGKAKGPGNGKKKGGGPMDDDDNDQRVRPLGAALIEIYNPRSFGTARTADVYSVVNETDGYDVGTNNGIDLRRLSITNGVTDVNGTMVANKPAPVWRIVMTQDNVDLDLRSRTTNQFINRDQIERAIYFVVEDNGDINADPAEYLKSELRYDLPSRVLSQNGMFLLDRTTFNAIVPMSGYSSAVIATAAIPITGSNSYILPLGRRTDVSDETVDVKYDETRSITVTAGPGGNAVVIRDLDAAGTARDINRGTQGIPILDLNISEPIGGYDLGGRTRSPSLAVEDMGGDQYTETIYRDSDGNQYVFDGPLDVNGRPNAAGDNQYDNFPPQQNESISSYRILHLQRLANPLAGWHAKSNPYLTVDSMPIDLAIFDGLDSSDLASSFDPDDGFGSKERGESAATSADRNLWAFEGDSDQPTAPQLTQAPADHYFRYYLEDPTNVEEDISFGQSNAGVINYSYDFVNNSGATAYGGTSPTFSGLAFNNRPFVGPSELMLVPHTSSSQLVRRYRSAPAGANNYAHDANSVDNGYGHLINFFQGSDGSAAGRPGPDFCRLLDYVYVPSRFGFTTSPLTSGTFGALNAPDLYMDVDEALNNNDLFSLDNSRIEDQNDVGFRAPANLIYDAREPGKVNMNTTFTAEVWDGVNGGFVNRGGHSMTNFVQLANSRRGNSALAQNIFDPINGPTYFPAPFRSSTGGNLVPDAGLLRGPVDNGKLRRRAAGNNLPAMAGTHPTVNANRHPLLRYLPRGRLDNLATTRSNVFGVWITVGYFEYDEIEDQIGREIGANTGEVERHRAFYMIDRSIPVGFEPGKNHNVDKTIMLRRYIE